MHACLYTWCVCVVCVVCSTHSYNACICMRACLYVCNVCVHACGRGMFLYTTHIHGGQRTTWEQRLLFPPFGSWESNSGRPSHLLVSSFTHWAILTPFPFFKKWLLFCRLDPRHTNHLFILFTLKMENEWRRKEILVDEETDSQGLLTCAGVSASNQWPVAGTTKTH